MGNDCKFCDRDDTSREKEFGGKNNGNADPLTKQTHFETGA
jgi:hypothetical protein